MRLNRVGFSLALALAFVPGAAFAQYGAAVAVPVGPQQGGGLPQGLAVMFQQPATTFRWTDGDWILRVGLTVTNTMGFPVTVHPHQFSAWGNGQAMSYWAPAASLRGPQTLMPGQSMNGTLAWYYSGSLPPPSTALVTSGGPNGAYRAQMAVMPGQGAAPVAQPVQMPPPPPPPPVMAPGMITPAVQFRFAPFGMAFRWTDADWIARVTVRITNTGPMPVQFNPSSMHAVGDGRPMSPWAAACTLRGPTMLMPGQTIAGTLAWYYSQSLPPPSSVVVTYDNAPWVQQVIRTPVPPAGMVPGGVR